MKMQLDDLKKMVENMFEKQRPVLSLWQTLADNFYPERADFTTTRNVGDELAGNLISSYPIIVRRDLGNSFSAMLRDGDWFEMGVNRRTDYDGKVWLQQSTSRMRKLFNQRLANFVRSTKQGDHDYATFGQTVISVEPNKQLNGLLFRNWHLRDCAWFDDENGQVCGFARKWKASQRDLISYFGEDKLDARIVEDFRKNPFKEIEVRHIFLTTEMFGDEELQGKYPYVSIFIDLTYDKVIEEQGLRYKMYTVPRFQTVAGSPYAYSPATVAGLPDARALQAMTHTLLEAGERFTRPPMLATHKAIRGDVDLSSNGITWLETEYDERLGEALRPLVNDSSGFPIGLEMRADTYEILSSAFYLNKLSLPEVTREMTAYEVAERMKQFRRENLPLFAPMESEYNGQLCENAFEIAMQFNMLGSPYDIPTSLRGADVEFKFESPLSQSEEEEKATRFQQTASMLREAAELDQTSVDNLNFDRALRDAITGIGAPTEWLNHPKQVGQIRQIRQIEQAAMMAQEAQANAG